MLKNRIVVVPNPSYAEEDPTIASIRHAASAEKLVLLRPQVRWKRGIVVANDPGEKRRTAVTNTPQKETEDSRLCRRDWHRNLEPLKALT